MKRPITPPNYTAWIGRVRHRDGRTGTCRHVNPARMGKAATALVNWDGEAMGRPDVVPLDDLSKVWRT